MKKRLRKKLAKKQQNQKQQQEAVEGSYGVISLKTEHPLHRFENGTEVQIVSSSKYGDEYLVCYSKERELKQTVPKAEIVLL